MTQRLRQVTSNGSVYTGCVTPMPGSPDIAVSHAVYHTAGAGGQGREANRQRCEQLKDLGFSAVVAYIRGTNYPQIAIMMKEGWTKGASVNPKRTYHVLYLWTKQL